MRVERADGQPRPSHRALDAHPLETPFPQELGGASDDRGATFGSLGRPLPPGTNYAGSADSEGRLGLYRLEVTMIPGNGRLRIPAGLAMTLKGSMNGLDVPSTFA